MLPFLHENALLIALTERGKAKRSRKLVMWRRKECGSTLLDFNPLALRRREASAGLGVFLGVLARSLGLERAGGKAVSGNVQKLTKAFRFSRERVRRGKYSRDLLLRPLEITADLLSVAHTLLEALACPRKASLRLLLEIH